MLAVVSTVNPTIILPSPLVTTAPPDATATVRVGADNVAPSVSIPAIDANNGGGTQTVVTAAPQSLTAEAASPPVMGGTFLISDGANFWASPQATFLAQVLSQDASPESQGLLVQYEKLVAFSNVKYKPSDATMPQPEPAGVFGRILQEEQARPAQNIPTPQQISAPAPTEKATALAATQTIQPVRATGTTGPRGIRQTSKGQAVNVSSSLNLQAASAYRSTVTRNTGITPEKSDAPIEEVKSVTG